MNRGDYDAWTALHLDAADANDISTMIMVMITMIILMITLLS
jgi:hypothetical protein